MLTTPAGLDADDTLDVLMARQPIYSKNQDIIAFELLFRSANGTDIASIGDDAATLDVITNSYASLSVGKQNQHLPCYIKVTDKILLNDQLPELPPNLFVLEILGRSTITPEFIQKVSDYAKRGYRIVLADYDPSDLRFDPLLNTVHVVKLDIQLLGLANIPSIVQRLRPYQLDLLADKVETKEEFRQCLEIGFSQYQGYFLSRPEPVKGRKIRGNKVILLQMLAELNREGATGDSLEQIAINDAALTYKILKVVNSAAFKTPKEISSLSHAIMLLGMEQMRRWVLLFLTTAQDGTPNALTRNLLVRGRMCELLASMQGYDDSLNFFVVGLLSQIDALFDQAMPDLLEGIPIQKEIKQAILKHEGVLGSVLEEVVHYERGEFNQLSGALPQPYYEVAYRHSLKWSDNVMGTLV
ncbi:HDOD domain-containing protein [Neptunomonas phycophila]|uniref:HDOD domain-containing protein n=1 Tax=Neptunomonas phycophila TaxID=1572645 RepID=A0ABT9EWT6_9GAMM|nr:MULTISPECIES: HDOD domain-containing protein [Neptunomonas]MDN2660814.1 HDOD domain-containing protein [Neptunomonas sp. CHC150]MDO6467935.1 HDOD domain-containing protein [Neptunomonas phycophila]MDP2523402.1 HDOD domain-containing protein [Neptunomonas phycophila]